VNGPLDHLLDILAAVPRKPAASSALATSCLHKWAFVPPARFNRPGASLPPRCDHYARDGVRICHICGAWKDAEPGDAKLYESGKLRDILVYWQRGRRKKARRRSVP
jgi:hypothetical protein